MSEETSVVSNVPPEVSQEPPFTIDAILQSTTRFTRKAWNVILELRDDLAVMRTTSIRCTLETKSVEAAETLQHELSKLDVKQMSRNAQVLSMTTTFETLQKVIKRPEVILVDLITL